MIETIQLFPGVTLYCFRDSRFKQGCLSIQLLRPMVHEEAAMNALLPSVLLRAEPYLAQGFMGMDVLANLVNMAKNK